MKRKKSTSIIIKPKPSKLHSIKQSHHVREKFTTNYMYTSRQDIKVNVPMPIMIDFV